MSGFLEGLLLPHAERRNLLLERRRFQVYRSGECGICHEHVSHGTEMVATGRHKCVHQDCAEAQLDAFDQEHR